MSHKFVIMIDGNLHTYDRYEDIPDVFDHVIEFSPEVPPPPHSDAEHHELEQWADKFDRLMEIENASSRS